MKNWFYKTFRARKVVRIRIVLESRRMLEYYRIPIGDEVEIIGVGTFKIDDENFQLTGKNIPTYHYEYGQLYPLTMSHGKSLTVKSPLEYQKALRNKVVEKLQEVMKPQLLDMKTLVIIGVNLMGLVGLYYMLQQEIAIIVEKLGILGI